MIARLFGLCRRCFSDRDIDEPEWSLAMRQMLILIGPIVALMLGVLAVLP